MERSHLQVLRQRLLEPRKFIQVLLGPRQAGKTTIINQLVSKIEIPYISESADAVDIHDGLWISRVWESARLQLKFHTSNEMLLIIDEIQKISNWSELVKREWDLDSKNNTNIKVVLLGSSRLILQQGLTESLAGRFEKIHVNHWSFQEMQEAFDWTLEQYIYYGAYPGAAHLIQDEARWKSYISDSLVESSISKDVLMLTRVDKPALLKRTFELGCAYSGQILSFTKMLGELQDAGNTTTLSHYVQLLNEAALMGGIEKYAGEEVRKRTSILKFQVYNNALLSIKTGVGFEEAQRNTTLWGRLVESAIGAHLLNSSIGGNYKLYYWREGSMEVDFVLEAYGKAVAIEVKSGKKSNARGFELFTEKFKATKSIIVGTGGIPLEMFLKTAPKDLF